MVGLTVKTERNLALYLVLLTHGALGLWAIATTLLTSQFVAIFGTLIPVFMEATLAVGCQPLLVFSAALRLLPYCWMSALTLFF